MACGYFEDDRICRCTAVGGLLTPSLYERERFCRSDGHARCRTYQIRARRKEALPQELYYALWLALAGDEPPLEGQASVP